LQSANTALMEGKRRGRSQLQAYSTTLSRQIRDRLELDGELNSAIAREQLRILVQPQLDRSGRLVGGEVLVHWRDHRGKDVPPAFFIPMAEQSGLIFPISNWVLNAALE
jgi:sensor c-di-GMP phosphodiesterase-like protein